jgi:hypothetical protein
MQTRLIRPGLLVSLSAVLKGGVQYSKTTIVPEHQEGVASIAAWETTRKIADAEEHARAVVARSKARYAITGVCCTSSFGLLCPQDSEAKLIAAIKQAQEIADAHNATANHTRLDVYVITGRVADNDVQAARAIGAEVKELIAAMEAGVKAANPEAIREAANKARALSGMLSAEAQGKVKAAINEVRSIARDIVKRVEQGAEVAAAVVDDVKLDALAAARFAVLDLTGEAVESSPQENIAGRAIDLEPIAPVHSAVPATPSFELGD